jgi:transcriptional regulator with XRE-family HTH domain
MKNYNAEDILTTLVNARKAKGLTQKALGEAIGWPQSHVSKFEKGGNDIRLSGLVELARALDLEIALVPKKSLPAVQSVVRQTQPPADDRSALALRTLSTLGEKIGRSDVQSALDSYKIAPGEIERVLIDLKPFRFSPEAFNRLQGLSGNLSKSLEIITGGFPRMPSMMESAARSIADSTKGLRELRNALAHPQGSHASTTSVRPAYALDEED